MVKRFCRLETGRRLGDCPISQGQMLADRPNWILIDNEGALFRGLARFFPAEVWDRTGCKPYTGTVPKPIEWGRCGRRKLAGSSALTVTVMPRRLTNIGFLVPAHSIVAAEDQSALAAHLMEEPWVSKVS
jgi:hypothetical protein